MSAIEAPLAPADLLPDGVHLGLPFDEYLIQGLGSTDLIRLFRHRFGWWWSSPHNPRHVETPRADLTYGQALHAIVLEGLGAYESRFAVRPEWPHALRTIPEMKAALASEGFTLGGKSAWLRDDWLRAMRVNAPRIPVFDNLEADWREKIGDRATLSADDDWHLRLMAEVVHDPGRQDNERVRTLFATNSAFPPLTEVSILATVDGIRRRWRLDGMFPRFDIDLKSLGNWSGRPLSWAVGDMIARYGYDIQRADYYDARARAYEFIAAGAVHGGTPEQRRWLGRFPEEFPAWDWVWIFYQKPDSGAGRAPVIFPVWDDSFDGERLGALRRYGSAKIKKALAVYREGVAEFGLDKPWARVEALHYTDLDADMDMAVHIPSWVAEDEPPAEEGAYR